MKTKNQKKHIVTLFGMLVAIIWIIPIYWLVITAFTEPTYRMSLLPSSQFTFSNFNYVWNAIPFGQYYINTITIVVITFIVQFVLSTLAAYALAVLDFKGKFLVYVIIFMQIIIPNDVLIIPNYMTVAELGLVDTKLGIMLPFFGSALAIFLLRQSFKSIPKALTEAAIIDGASVWTIIWKIYMPNARATYLSFGVISVSYHWNNYLWPLIVTNSPKNRPLTVGLAIFAKSKEANIQWANVAAATLIIIFPLLLAFLFFQKQFIGSFVSSGIKD